MNIREKLKYTDWGQIALGGMITLLVGFLIFLIVGTVIAFAQQDESLSNMEDITVVEVDSYYQPPTYTRVGEMMVPIGGGTRYRTSVIGWIDGEVVKETVEDSSHPGFNEGDSLIYESGELKLK